MTNPNSETLQEIVERKIRQNTGADKAYPNRKLFEEAARICCEQLGARVIDFSAIDRMGLSPPQATIIGAMLKCCPQPDGWNEQQVALFRGMAHKAYLQNNAAAATEKHVSFTLGQAMDRVEDLLSKISVAREELLEKKSPQTELGIEVFGTIKPDLPEPPQPQEAAPVNSGAIAEENNIYSKAKKELDALAPYSEEQAATIALRFLKELFDQSPFAKQHRYASALSKALKGRVSPDSISDWVNGRHFTPETLLADHLVADLVTALGVTEEQKSLAERILLGIPFDPKDSPIVPQILHYAIEHPEIGTKEVLRLARRAERKTAEEYAASVGTTHRQLRSYYDYPPRVKTAEALADAMHIARSEDRILWRQMLAKIPLSNNQQALESLLVPGIKQLNIATRDITERKKALSSFFTMLAHSRGFLNMEDLARDIAAQEEGLDAIYRYISSSINDCCSFDRPLKRLHPDLAQLVTEYALPDNFELRDICSGFLGSAEFLRTAEESGASRSEGIRKSRALKARQSIQL